jgi:hypothetical protein
MITKEIFKYLIQTINPETLQQEIDSTGDYLLLEMHTFNVGSYGTIKSLDYDEEEERRANDNGDLFMDKDDFLRLCEDLEVFEY